MGPKKRKADEANAPTQPDAIDWMNDVLECPVCLDVMKEPPIYICENPQGHSLCSKCHDSLLDENKPCPVCRLPLGNRRNLGLESMVTKLPKCRFDGCDFMRSDETAVKKHEDDCEKRYVPCAYCDDAVGMEILASHIIGKHGIKPMQYQWMHSGSILLNSCRQTLMNATIVDEKNPDFLFNWYKKKNIRMFWISHIGPKDSAKKFKFTFKLKKDKNSEEKLLEITRRVLPCDISQEQVKKQKRAIILDKELIEDAKQDKDGHEVIYYDLIICKQ